MIFHCQRLNSHMPLWLFKLLPGFILFFAALNYTILVGERRIFSVTLSTLHQEFGNKTSLMELNGIGAACHSLTYFIVPFLTNVLILLNRPYQVGVLMGGAICSISYIASSFVKWPALLYLTYSGVHMIGAAIVVSIVFLIVGEYFDRTHRFHLVATMLISQGAIGGLVYGSADGLIIAKFGFRNMFVIVGSFMLFWMTLAAFVFIPKPRNDNKEEEMDSWRKRPIWVLVPWNHLKSNLQIVFWWLERIIHHIITASLYMNIVDFLVVHHEMSTEYASTILIAWSFGETVILLLVFLGPLLHPWLCQVYFFCSIVTIPITGAIAFVHHKAPVMFTLIFLQGFFISGCKLNDYATSMLVMRIHGSVSFPSTLMMHGLGYLCAPMFSGFLIDTFAGYREFFFCQMGLSILRCLLWLAILTILQFKSHELIYASPQYEPHASSTQSNEGTPLVDEKK